MSTATLLIGDVFAGLATIPDGSVDLVLTSPPFLALRSYLPADHPDKALEIGSEATPAEFLDTLLAVTAELRRVLAPHGSIAIELGDTYAGSGGAGGDYADGGLRDGQAKFSGTAAKAARAASAYRNPDHDGGALRDRAVDEALGVRPARSRLKGQHPGWPLDKSLCGIPQAYQLSLAYGRNILTGDESPAGLWRVRTLKPWIRSNPPVGALGDKERPATSYVTVATVARDRYFDLDAVRVQSSYDRPNLLPSGSRPGATPPGNRPNMAAHTTNAAGAPPCDWWHEVDAVLDAALEEFAGGTTHTRAAKGTRRKSTGKQGADERGGNWASPVTEATGEGDDGRIRGRHLRRALERVGILRTLEALDVSPKGYSGAHYAVFPPLLAKPLILEMCPERVCRTCGEPSRRIVETQRTLDGEPADLPALSSTGRMAADADGISHSRKGTKRTDLGFTDCGHDDYRRGLVLDPFAGSGTTLEVATGNARDAIGIDLDSRNVALAEQRVGMFLADVRYLTAEREHAS